MIELDQYPDGPIERLDGGVTIGSAFITIEPRVSEFSWRLQNEIRDMRWETLVWMVGERFVLELSDLDDAICAIGTYLSHGEG